MNPNNNIQITAYAEEVSKFDKFAGMAFELTALVGVPVVAILLAIFL